MIFNLVFAINTILSYFFFLLLFIDLTFNFPQQCRKFLSLLCCCRTSLTTEIPTKEATSEIKTHSATVEDKINKWSV